MSDGRNESAAGCAELAECVSDLINTLYVEFGFGFRTTGAGGYQNLLLRYRGGSWMYDQNKSKMSEWISVDDLLPHDWQEVICCNPVADGFMYVRSGVYTESHGFYDGVEWGSLYPSHWMPMPEHPKQQGDE